MNLQEEREIEIPTYKRKQTIRFIFKGEINVSTFRIKVLMKQRNVFFFKKDRKHQCVDAIKGFNSREYKVNFFCSMKLFQFL